jgi:pimeloyl-ACP methyl ester carboxylesterase
LACRDRATTSGGSHGERQIQAAGVTLSTEAFGDPTRPPVLLIMGATASMLWWDAEFCERLARRGYYVIRYDNRDVGRSATYPPGESHYTIVDLADDALRVLDAYELERAHLVGLSLGGMIAQIAALRQAPRVASLVLISTSAYGARDPALPSIDPKIMEHFGRQSQVDWSDERHVEAYLTGFWKLQSGSAHIFDEAHARRLARAEFRRAKNIRSMFNHALIAGGAQYVDRAGDIRQPVLIVHGTEDPVLPIEHGRYLMKQIPHARMIEFEGGGHELHRADWDRLIRAIVDHMRVVPDDPDSTDSTASD